jgi:signal transduction histidine kinase
MARPQRPARDIDPPSPAHEWRGALWSPEQAPPGALASAHPSQDQALAYARDLSTLYRAERQRAARFRLLVEMGKDLTAVRALDALLELALQRATAFRGHDGGSVLLLRAPEGPLEVCASLGVAAAERGTVIEDLTTSAAGQALRARRPLVLEGYADEGGTPEREYSKDIPSAVCLPLVTPGGKPVGVLALKSTTRALHLDGDDLEALQLLASQLAAAVESARLNERLDRSLDALLALHQAGQILGSTLELDAIGGRLLHIATRVSGLPVGVLSLRSERERLGVWQAVGSASLWRWARQARAARAARRAALSRGAPRMFALPPPAGERTPWTGWCLPLRVQHRLVGVLEVFGPETPAREATAETLGNLANQGASALENARLYRELAERERQLQSLVGRLLVAQEEERRRVAYDIHDGVAQVAAGAYQHLQAFASAYRPRSPEARGELERSLALARRTVGDARRVIADLRPTALDDFGLATALRLEVEALCADGWQATYQEALGAERLPPAVETALFRVTQEALTNVRKHAGTTRVHVALRRQGRSVRLEVQDWGRGFGPAVGRAGAGPGERVGMSGMQERVALLGGRCQVRSRPGAGTRVAAEVPLPTLADGDV